MKRKALGKGLSALCRILSPGRGPDRRRPGDGRGTGGQPRAQPVPAAHRPWIPRASASSRASIRESGIVQPILVRRHGRALPDHRGRAALAGGPAGRPRHRARRRCATCADDRLLELALVENIQRQELSPLEEAQAFHRLQEELRLTQEEVARKVGRDRSTVANTLRLLRLPARGARAARRGRPRRRARPRPPRPRTGRGPDRAGARGGAQGPVRARGGAARRAPARPAGRSRPRQGRQHARGRGAPARGPRHAGRDRAPRPRGPLRIAFASEAELNRLYELLVRPGRPRPSERARGIVERRPAWRTAGGAR